MTDLENIDPSSWGKRKTNDENGDSNNKKPKLDKTTKDAILVMIHDVESRYKNKHAPGIQLTINIVKRYIGIEEGK